VPNGGLYSTPTDLAKFIMANLGYSDLLDSHHLESLHSNQTPETRFRHYGLGFELYRDQTFAIAGHTGGLPGYSADLEFEKMHGYGVIFMRNYNWGTTSWDIGPKVLLRKLAESDKRL
jgi:CubicO group peptidase (beta-lactamase class C family)